MAPGPASLESKQERPSSDRQATVLLYCYHCWPYPADLTGADAMNFILKISTVQTELALLETFLPSLSPSNLAETCLLTQIFSDILM